MHRRDRITRADAERLFDTGVGGPEAVEALLAAAMAPSAARELAGERAALAEFRAAHLATVPSRRKTAMLKSVVANLAAAKVVLAATAAAAATGGIALAAATGSLPGTAQGGNHAPQLPPAAGSKSAHASVAAAPSHESEPGSEPSEAAATHGSATPSPSLDGLCRAYQKGVAESRGKALQNPAFSVLITAAGGKDNVAGFCEERIGAAPTHPGGAPETHRRGAPASHPGAHPTHPTGAPATHPTGAPTSRGHP